MATSKLIKDQLAKCVFAKPDSFDPETKVFHIPKYSKPIYKLGKTYVIKVPIAEVDNPNSILAINWNKGSFPPNQYLLINVTDTKGIMIYVDSRPYSLTTNSCYGTAWSGWLDAEQLEQLQVKE